MGSKNLVIAAAVLAMLSGAVWWAKRHPDSGTDTTKPAANTQLINVPAASVTGIDIAKKGSAPVQLSRQSGKWAITAPEQYSVDQGAVDSITSALSPATADDVVEAKAADTSQFGLTAPSLVVTVHEKNGKTDKISFGDDIPAGSSVYASAGSDPKVYAVPSSVKSSFDKSLADLRDKRLLPLDATKLTQVELDNSKGAVVFAKNNGGEWQMAKPAGLRADNFQVEELVRKLGDAKMDLGISTDDQKKANASFADGTPIGAAKTTDASGTQTLVVHKSKEDYYAHSSIGPGAYKISSDIGKEIEKTADDFRNKKIFDFGWSDPMKLQLEGQSGSKTFVRSGTDWKLDGKTMDPGNVQSLIDKLRDLSATKFATTGFSPPVETVTVVSNDGKRTERVEFAKVPDGYLARRAGEPTLYQMDAKAADDILGASKSIKPAAATKK